MAYEILMPQLGLTMEEGTVSGWLKHEGDAVKAGEAILEITTDKLTNEVTSEHDGVLRLYRRSRRAGRRRGCSGGGAR